MSEEFELEHDQDEGKRQDRLAADYKAIFEIDKRGQAIWADLYRRFGQEYSVVDGGIDAVLKTYRNAGHHEVLDHILRMIDRSEPSE